MTKPVTIKDVARYAGVGLGTASRVLNKHPSVKEETRKAVMDAMEALNYNPNAIARSLKSNTTRSVGVMIPDISSAFYPEIVRGIEDAALVAGYNIILCNTDLDRLREKVSLNMLKEKQVDGIIFISNTIDENLREEFMRIAIPLVLVATSDQLDELNSVTVDNVKGSFMAVDMLCKLGHTNIVMIAGDKTDPNAGIPRIEGYKKALERNGIPFDENKVYYGNYRFKSGYECMKEIIKSKKLPTAVFAASDSMAIGAANAILSSGLRIPEDISVVGFDGIEAAEFFYPPLSTVKQPRYEMGKKGMELLMKRIQNEPILESRVMFDCQLIERQSHRSLLEEKE